MGAAKAILLGEIHELALKDYRGKHKPRTPAEYEALFKEGVEKGWIDESKLVRDGTLQHLARNNNFSESFITQLSETNLFQKEVEDVQKLEEAFNITLVHRLGWGKHYSDKQDRALVLGRATARTWKELGTMLGKSASAVRSHYARLTGRWKR